MASWCPGPDARGLGRGGLFALDFCGFGRERGLRTQLQLRQSPAQPMVALAWRADQCRWFAGLRGDLGRHFLAAAFGAAGGSKKGVGLADPLFDSSYWSGDLVRGCTRADSQEVLSVLLDRSRMCGSSGCDTSLVRAFSPPS